jgi:transposase InsO family protein
MEAIYYDPRQPGSYGGAEALYRRAKELDPTTSRKAVANWLSEQETYSLHKPVRRRFVRRKIYSRGIDYLWQADLADVGQLASSNDGYRYLLTVVDVFSKRAWAVPLKKKDAASVTEAFDGLLLRVGRQPTKLQTDKGKEFVNAPFQAMLRRRGVQFYVGQNEDIKASVVERFNRTLKSKMWRYFTHRNTYKYIDALDDLLHSYNNSYHRTIGRTPASVTRENEAAVRERMYGSEPGPSQPRLKAGDRVRVSKTRRTFGKGYEPNWTEELFVVSEALRTTPPTYRLKDYADEPIEGTFYDRELQRAEKKDEVYKIEKVLKTRRPRGGGTEYLVKWRGWPDKFNSWVGEADVQAI